MAATDPAAGVIDVDPDLMLQQVAGCVDFALALTRTHRTLSHPPGLNCPPRCSCGRAATVCEINAAGRAAGLLPPLNWPAPGTTPSGSGRAAAAVPPNTAAAAPPAWEG